MFASNLHAAADALNRIALAVERARDEILAETTAALTEIVAWETAGACSTETAIELAGHQHAARKAATSAASAARAAAEEAQIRAQSVHRAARERREALGEV